MRSVILDFRRALSNRSLETRCLVYALCRVRGYTLCKYLLV